MTWLTNLLPLLPGHSGFGSYVRRVLPGIPGLRLLLEASGRPVCRGGQTLPGGKPTAPHLRLLQRFSLTQRGVDVVAALRRAGLEPDQLRLVYSPFCDYLFALPQVPQVITCHDLTPLHVPNSRKAWLRYRYGIPGHLARAARVIAISGFVAGQLREIGVAGERIEVVWNGVEVQRPRIEAPAGPDLLMLARHDGNKNVAFVVRAFARLLALHPDWPGRLLVVGRRGRQTPLLHELGRDLCRADRLRFIEAVNADTLLELLRGSLALISSSTMEGFDYPVLEAKAEGLPTLVSSIPVHHEVHDGSSLFFRLDQDGEELRSHLLALAHDNTTWNELSQSGYRRAGQLNLARQRQAIHELLAGTSR
jgi:glycosyltransferase involved in cell wall biosynthesis